MERIQAVFQVCLAATVNPTETLAALVTTEIGGAPRPMAQMRGTDFFSTTLRLSTAGSTITGAAFQSAASKTQNNLLS